MQFVDRAFPIIQSEPSLQKPSDGSGGDATSALDQLHAKTLASTLADVTSIGHVASTSSDGEVKNNILRNFIPASDSSDSSDVASTVSPNIISPPVSAPASAPVVTPIVPPIVPPIVNPVSAADTDAPDNNPPAPVPIDTSLIPPNLTGEALKAHLWRLFHGATGVRDLAHRLAPLHLNSNFVQRLIAAKRLSSFVPDASDRLISSIGAMHGMSPASLSLAETHPNVFSGLLKLYGRG
jgi:hypothetical protein